MGCWPDGAPVSWPPPSGDTAAPRRSSLASWSPPSAWGSPGSWRPPASALPWPPSSLLEDLAAILADLQGTIVVVVFLGLFAPGFLFAAAASGMASSLQAPWEQCCYQRAESGWYASSQPQHQTGHWGWWSWWWNHIQQCQAFSSILWLQMCRAIGLCLTNKIKMHDIY